MAYWLAQAADVQREDWIKRFDPRYWTVNFPRPMMASVTTPAADALQVDLAFLKSNDLAGLIWESADRFDHPLLRYRTARDYRGVQLGFRWQSNGAVMRLDAVNGPVLTIEGRDAAGNVRAWYVRLWNYAVGNPDDARIELDFDNLSGGFLHPSEADPVWAGDIDRLFISLVPADFDGIDAPLASAVEAIVTLSAIRCDGSGSTIAIGDSFVPPHSLRVASGYDDSYHVAPARLLRGMVQMGYQGLINHYVGMSHYPALRWDSAEARFVADSAATLNQPCERWHSEFATLAQKSGFELILSLSFELLDQMAPLAWKQYDANGNPALTGWSPPSTLLSPTNIEAMAYLAAVARSFVAIAVAAGLAPRFQLGEPWWWVGPNNAPSFYDATTKAAYTAETGLPVPPAMVDVRQPTDAAQRAFMNWLGVALGRATLALRDSVRAAAPETEALLLFYAPQLLRADAPDLQRVNLPSAWAFPAWDVLQFEDYDFVTGRNFAGQQQARDAATTALGYPVAAQHYFSGFVLSESDRDQWAEIDAAIVAARARGVAETFVWAWPQIARDGFTTFELSGDETMPAFHDVLFPLELGYGAAGGPRFSTQIVVMSSGFEQRNSSWADARLHYDAGVGIRSEADLAALIRFFRARHGQAHAFRFRDPLDHSSRDDSQPPTPTDQFLGIGDGVRTRFDLIKTYGDGDDPQVRRISRPVAGSVRVAVGGSEVFGGWQVAARGAIDFDVAPLAAIRIEAGYDFDVPVRFAEDRIDVSLAGYQTGDLPSIPLVEVREV